MEQEPPGIEQSPATTSDRLQGEGLPGRNLLLLKIFALTFLAVAAIGLAYTYTQPVVYRSQATMLVPGQPGISEQEAVKNAQRIAAQQHVLFSDELMAGTRARMAADGYGSLAGGEIRRLLTAQAVAGTNRVAIIAEGDDAEVLPRILNSWVDVYLAAHAAVPDADAGQDEQAIPEELAQLDLKLVKARTALEQFRQSHDISATPWNEKDANARLKELDSSIKSAKKVLEASESALSKAQEDIARGESVASRASRSEIGKLERKLDTLETQLADLDARYTRAFLELNPKLRVLPEQIEELKVEIEQLSTESNQQVMNALGDDRNEARKTVAALQREIDEHRQRGESFASVEVEHKALIKSLEDLEALDLETRARLAEAGSLKIDSYPELRLMTRATVSDEPIGDDVSQHAIISLSTALGTALLAAWIYGFLNPAHSLNAAKQPADSEAGLEDEQQLAMVFQPTAGEPPPADQGGPDTNGSPVH